MRSCMDIASRRCRFFFRLCVLGLSVCTFSRHSMNSLCSNVVGREVAAACAFVRGLRYCQHGDASQVPRCPVRLHAHVSWQMYASSPALRARIIHATRRAALLSVVASASCDMRRFGIRVYRYCLCNGLAGFVCFLADLLVRPSAPAFPAFDFPVT